MVRGRIKSYWFGGQNFGDNLTPDILKFLGYEVERATRADEGKFLAVGSILQYLQKGDTVWGSGLIKAGQIKIPKDVKFLAVRGKLTEKELGINVGVYGDPALLLPLFYKPNIKPTKKIGIVPHYVDQHLFTDFIDVKQDWKKAVDQILECKKIISSSLHGLIIAYAYDIDFEWIEFSDKVIGNGFKFRDFFTTLNIPKKELQDNLINSLYENTRN